jgi:hypothetical protein
MYLTSGGKRDIYAGNITRGFFILNRKLSPIVLEDYVNKKKTMRLFFL